MSDAGSRKDLARATRKPLVASLLISLAVHGGLFGLAAVFGVASALKAMNAKSLAELQRFQQQQQAKARQQQPEPPLMFLEVDPAQAAMEAPKNAKYYAAHNSLAANPDPQVETGAPKIEGTQTHVPKTETAPRSKAVPLQPLLPKPAAPEPKQAEAKPKGGQSVGDLALAKPNPNPKPTPKPDDGRETPETHQRPRTLEEAMKQKNSLAGEKMKQDGGVKRAHMGSTLDAKGTPFADYDGAVVAAIQQRWYDLLDKQATARERSGRVILEFRLNDDGRITDMKVIENDVGDLLGYICQAAVLDNSPYKPWPMDMKRMMQARYREVRFTFFYD